ncbi:hypothetical protein [Agarilytica rhodophyticola]|uniref:hypothetical protein n=1 Tax=Agarilytica rhodophyticola TaxID=1737490 RepID=UPI000B349641|nr:hypothetical protein [Agarilytica rhodophyticola]
MRKYNAEELAFMSQYHITQRQFNYISLLLKDMEAATDNIFNVALLNNGIGKDIRLAALKLRPQFLTDPFCELSIDEKGLKVIPMTSDTYSGIENDTEKHVQKEQYSQDEQFKAFIEELTRLSQKHGVVLHVTGGVTFVNPGAPCLHDLQYSSDATSGDLEPINGYD